ncbi:hypothetical protein E2562_026416, partial [Oryza meyeriana var. granulata]
GNMVDAFRMHIMQTKELGTCPVRQIGGCSFLYMRISNVYIVIVVSSNANVACAFKFVVEAVALFKSYFGGAFDEDAIRNNFVLIYELLDEIMDFGYPQNLSPEILKLYITQEGVRSPFSSKPSDKPVPNATLQVTGAVGWRREGLVYKKNEVFLDIVESVNLLMSSKGSVLRCDVTGKILMKCFLSGMPDLKLGLNDKIGLEKEAQLKSRPAKSGKTIELDDVTFHQCVNLTRFNSEKTVSFVPPDGEFELMKYRITEGVNLPFRVLPTIKELGRTRMEINVKVKSVFGAKMFALGVVVKVPVPKQTAKTSFQTTSGKAKYNASIDSLVWKIRKFPGQTEATMSAEVELISTMGEKKSWNRPPIQMEFQVPMFTASGLRVRFLKVWEKSGYNTVEWVRYITRAGSYEIRDAVGGLDRDLFVALLAKLIGESRRLQNDPPALVPQEDLVAQHVVDALLPVSTDTGEGPLVLRKVSYAEGRSNVIVEYPGTVPDRVVSFVGMHMDVVPANPDEWDFDPFSLTFDSEDKDKLRGRGTTDCLGHVALVAQLMRRLGEVKPVLKHSVIAVFIANEENSLITGVGVDGLVKDGLLDKLKNGPLFWIDTADKQPCIGTGGVITWHLKAIGKLFHSGLAHKAINSMELNMEALKEIQTMFYNDFPPHEKEKVYKFATPSTIKPTKWSYPGGGLNQIPGECTISGDIRLTPFYSTASVMKKLREYVGVINEKLETKLQTRGPVSKYVLPDENLRGRLEITIDEDVMNGVACNLESRGFHALCKATKEIVGHVEPYSITGSLPLIRELQDEGFDVQTAGYVSRSMG